MQRPPPARPIPWSGRPNRPPPATLPRSIGAPSALARPFRAEEPSVSQRLPDRQKTREGATSCSVQHVVTRPRDPLRSKSGALTVHQVPAWQDNLVWILVCNATG